jgi:hypothetical protein
MAHRPASPRRAVIARREVLVGALAGVGALTTGFTQPEVGAHLYGDVVTYDGFGSHRTGSVGDARTSAWVAERLALAGFTVDRLPFAIEVFEPTACFAEVGRRRAPAFPLWPPVSTPAGGVSGRLELGTAAGGLAVVRLPYAPNASLLVPGYREPLVAAVSGGARGVIGITEGPTGEVIALNAVPASFSPSVPVVLVGARDGALVEGARSRLTGRLVSLGMRRASTAHNIVGSRRGEGRALVISTPSSGWFTCAGERGAGLAIFLRLARELPRLTRRPLVFLCTSGHEIEGAGSEHALARGLPRPERVEAWFHIGANVAGAQVAIGKRGAVVTRGDPIADRGTRASARLVARAQAAFASVPGFRNVALIDAAGAVGDIVTYVRAGYTQIAGIVGSHPLHHTRLDRPRNATTPELLQQTYDGCLRLLRSI